LESAPCSSNSDWKCFCATSEAVGGGGVGASSTTPESGDLAGIACAGEFIFNEDERLVEERGGVTTPTLWREDRDGLLRRGGDDERVFMLKELELRRRGLGGGPTPFVIGEDIKR
jgi:hypothetical protein